MKRRALFGKIATAAAVVAVGPVVTAAEATPVRDTMADADLWANGYLAGLDQQMADVKRVDVPNAVVVGALYDFMGRLTTLDEPITVSRSHEVYGVMEAFQAWARDRGLDINVADVEHWHERVAATTGELSPVYGVAFSKPPTFEAMQADCAARGCSLAWQGQPFDGPAVPTHTQASGPTGENADTRWFYAAGAPLTVVDAWRTSLHGEDG